VPEAAELKLDAFFTLFVRLAFCKEYPRQATNLFMPPQGVVIPGKAPPRLDEATAVCQALRKFLDSSLPRMRASDGPMLRAQLERDVEIQAVLTQCVEMTASLSLRDEISEMTASLSLRDEISEMTASLYLRDDISEMTASLYLRDDISEMISPR
jgi:hypothetical protein